MKAVIYAALMFILFFMGVIIYHLKVISTNLSSIDDKITVEAIEATGWIDN